MSQGLTLPAAPPATGYFQRTLPVYLILGTFVVVTLPLSCLALLAPQSTEMGGIQFVYVCVFGLTHFVLTPTIYLQSNNLRYFNSSWRNRILYFVIPVAILVGFDLYLVLGIAALFPSFNFLFRLAIRLFDFNHFARQSFGVLQLFKVRSGGTFPAWLKRVESAYFFSVPVTLLMTFLQGGVCNLDSPLVKSVLGLSAGLFVTVLIGYGVALSRAAKPAALLPPLTYFLFQTASALLAYYSTALYAFALAMHYVEYHVLMMPRCFHAKLDTEKKPDRVFALLRRNKLIFYGLVLVLAVVASLLMSMSIAAMAAMIGQAADLARENLRNESSPFYLMLIAVFDGLFVFHYFVESFIWRFSDPYYRQTLGPLYFSPRPSVPGR
jgi:hypothetical protein